jgi:plasmid maintenance system antidote protein VapI
MSGAIMREMHEAREVQIDLPFFDERKAKASFARAIAIAKAKSGHTYTRIAQAIGISRNTLAQTVNYGRPLRNLEMERLVKVYGKDVSAALMAASGTHLKQLRAAGHEAWDKYCDSIERMAA